MFLGVCVNTEGGGECAWSVCIFGGSACKVIFVVCMFGLCEGVKFSRVFSVLYDVDL